MARRPRKKLKRLNLWDGSSPSVESREPEPTGGQEPVAEEQLFLGPYPVMKALPTFENVTFGKLRGTVQAERPPMVWIDPGSINHVLVPCSSWCLTLILFSLQKELDEYAKIRREVKRRIQQARTMMKKKARREHVRKKRRKEHERNMLRRRRAACHHAVCYVVILDRERMPT